jgi:hypothetical protein
MRNTLIWLRWMLASTLGALVAIPLGYGVAVVTAILFSIVLAFFGMPGVVIGSAAGNALGGAIAGALISQAQRYALGPLARDNGTWLWRGAIIWGVAGLLFHPTLMPIMYANLRHPTIMVGLPRWPQRG